MCQNLGFYIHIVPLGIYLEPLSPILYQTVLVKQGKKYSFSDIIRS